MESYEDFRQQLQHALLHLNDPDYVIADDLCRFVLSSESQAPSLSAFQTALIGAIEAQKYPAGAALGSRAEFIYQILEQRFILGFTQEQVAEKLNLSVRSMQRLQREAIHILARFLWSRRNQNEEVAADAVGQDTVKENRSEWSAQLKRELLLLQNQSPNMECELGEVIAGAVRIVQATTNSANSETIQILFPEDRFRATVQFHPSVLRQVFVDLLSEMLHIRGIRQLHFAGQSSTNRYKVLMTASPATGAEVLDFPTANELLIYQGGGIEIRHLEDALTIEVDLPLGKASQPVHVLVVDDNLDLVNLYQSYCAGTPFQIHHVREGGKVFESIRALHPDIIMLDILLPDVNGLDLLLNLHANPETRSIPIIICSVIVDERLVHDLGAALFLRKPVWKQQLLTSLEQALSGSTQRLLVNPG